MFTENKYTKWYFNIITNALNRSKDDSINYEIHHIIPRCMGGSDDNENLVPLSLREHFICHLLLPKMVNTKILQHKLIWSIHRMMFSKKYIVSSRLYETYRNIFIQSLIENHPSKTDTDWNKKLSERTFNTWKDNTKRRAEQAERMKRLWASRRTEMKEKARHNSLKAAATNRGKNHPRILQIEYNGKIYFGWKDLRQSTGITQETYKRYYHLGIDPATRINKHGPIKK